MSKWFINDRDKPLRHTLYQVHLEGLCTPFVNVAYTWYVIPAVYCKNMQKRDEYSATALFTLPDSNDLQPATPTCPSAGGLAY